MENEDENMFEKEVVKKLKELAINNSECNGEYFEEHVQSKRNAKCIFVYETYKWV